ncbi:hypothetical protein V7056_20115, partial [Bacillus sp. JJ664]
QNVFILTYLFDGQIQKYYYDLHSIKYRYLSVINDEYEGYKLVPYKNRIPYNKKELKDNIDIYCGHLNKVGDYRNNLSKSWFEKAKNQDAVKQLKKNARNYFMNISKKTVNEVMWTTIRGEKDKRQKGKIEKKVCPSSYANGFVPMTSRATNKFKEKDCLAYLVNRFLNPIEKKFFEQYRVKVNESTWALSELIQWVWRSRIRDGLPIQIYIPSKRMRDLLIQYLESEIFEEAPINAIVDEAPSDWHL